MEVDLEIDLRLASPILSKLDGVLMLHDDRLKRHYRMVLSLNSHWLSRECTP